MSLGNYFSQHSQTLTPTVERQLYPLQFITVNPPTTDKETYIDYISLTKDSYDENPDYQGIEENQTLSLPITCL